MKKITWGLVAIIIFTACACSSGGSSDAEITEFSLEGAIGNPVIDANTDTVTLTVQPMDLSDAHPTVGVSTGASLSSQPALKDGTAVNYMVTAEDGTTKQWKVTANVQFGATFTLNGSEKVYLKGKIDSSDSTESAKMGNGVPAICAQDVNTSPRFQMWACDKLHDQAVSSTSEFPHSVLHLCTKEITAGTYSSHDDEIDTAVTRSSLSQLESSTSPALIYYKGREQDSLTMTLDYVGPVGGNVKGTFTGVISNYSDTTDVYTITKGYFKLLRLADDSVN